MNSKDKQRWVRLITEQFCDRRTQLRGVDHNARDEEVSTWIAAKVSSMKLTAKMNKIKAAKQSLQKLEQSLSAEVVQKLGIKVDDDCGCHESADRILNQYATKELAKSRTDSLAKLGNDERHLLAQVELAETAEDIAKIARAAGLL